MPLFNNNAAIAQGNYNYGDSYSTYPTDDNKYECQTGPFEWFFVGSVEFCKHVKFDDNKRDHRDNNQTGTQGPQGPPGATGPQGFNGTDGQDGQDGINGTDGAQGLPGETGAIGPQGPNQINSTSIYTVSGPGNSTSAIFPTATDIAKCLPGDTVLSDSFNATMFGPPSVIVDFALPTQDGWQTSITRESNANILFNTLAQCFNNPFFYLFLITDTCYNY